jgi:DNA-binding transcriptional ArsR family regulator
VIEAIEELSSARRAAGLAPRHSPDEEPIESTPEIDAKEARLAAYMADIDAALWGAYAPALPDVDPPVDPDAFLVGGFIRPGTTVMLTGPPGSSKSWAARQLAMECAAGLHTFLGHYAIARPLNVLLIDEDNGPDEEWRRDEALLSSLGLQRGQLGRLRRLSLGGVQLDSESWQHWLRGSISLHSLDLVILDPISEMHGGKELREDPAFRSLLGFLKRLKVDFPALATLLVHHTRKVMPGDRSPTRGLDDVRGQWGQTPDVVALMWGLGERRVAWELHKRVPHSKLILEASDSGPLHMVADETTSSAKAMSTDDRVMASLGAGAETADEIITATGLSRSGVFKALKRLAGAGLVTARAPYQLVEEREIQGVTGD